MNEFQCTNNRNPAWLIVYVGILTASVFLIPFSLFILKDPAWKYFVATGSLIVSVKLLRSFKSRFLLKSLNFANGVLTVNYSNNRKIDFRIPEDVKRIQFFSKEGTTLVVHLKNHLGKIHFYTSNFSNEDKLRSLFDNK